MAIPLSNELQRNSLCPPLSPADEDVQFSDSGRLHPMLAALEARLNNVLKGKADVVEMVLVCLLARGHLLLEDRPGLVLQRPMY